MAELHVIGQLVAGTEFDSGKCLFCKFQVEVGASWKILGGCETGQTQASSGTYNGGTVLRWDWCHPIDVHYATRGVQGWPKIACQVYHLDSNGRCVLEGYGVTHVPSSPGIHQLKIPCWRPVTSSLKDQLVRTFLGGSVVLRNNKMAFGAEDRYRLRTTGSGFVSLELTVVARHFGKFGVQLA
jgi:B9 domain-containing protein 2